MFKQFSAAVHAKYANMAKREMFVVDTEDLFTNYLLAFPEGTNPIFRKQTEHDCSCCKNFIRNLGNLVIILENGQRETVWSAMNDLPYPYNIVALRLDEIVRQAPIKTVFRSKERQYGTEYNWGAPDGENGPNVRFDHFYGRVEGVHFAPDPATKRGEREAIHQVLQRGLEEISPADLDTVLDLIEANGLYRGAEHKAAVIGFSNLLQDYRRAADRETFIWSKLDDRNARFRNTVIGTLLTDLADGKPLDQAVRMFEAKVAPANYKRPTALITPKMVEQAQETLEKLGLEGALNRRFARISDVTVNNVLFVDNAVRGSMKGGIAALLGDAVKPKTVDIKHAETISIDDFMKLDIDTMDMLVKASHLGNFVSLTGGDGPERLFKWNNNFAWSYDGEVADSIKERVKAAGGNVTNAKLRISLAWSNSDDLDIYCKPPQGPTIYFGNRSGVLDVDMNAGGQMNAKNPVENLSWSTVQDGVYRVSVNNFTRRGGEASGFTLEIESDGKMMQFYHAKQLGYKDTSDVLEVTVKGGVVVNVNAPKSMTGTGGDISVDKWGVTTSTLVPVEVVMHSPNFWDDQTIGNKHWFFMLKGCKNPGATRGIYNEFLRSDLDQHRKVFEVLGSRTKCQPSDDQLSGLGFSSTRSDTVTIVVNGRRAYNVEF